jgi:hypothetical protein
MPLARDYFKMSFVNAEGLQPNVFYDATILSAGPHKFENGEVKLIIGVDWRGKFIVLNRTRGEILMDAFGEDFDLWPGKKIRFFRGTTLYQGKTVGCVAVEPVVIEQLPPADERPALIKPKPDIRSGRGGWDDPPAPTEYDGPNDDPQAA